MSILSAIRQQSSSIDDLAKLPQAMIMQMAQRKQIATEMVAPILARKAEMIDAASKLKAMQGGVPQTSVMEQIIAQNSAAEQPQMESSGVAQLPVPERQYAGGGIIAFSRGSLIDSDDDEIDAYDDYAKAAAAVQRANAMPVGIASGKKSILPQSYESALAEKGQTPASARKLMIDGPKKGDYVMPPLDAPKRGGHKYEGMVIQEAQRLGLDPSLAVHVLYKETGNLKNPETAKSSAGAIGVMQLMPKTAKSLGVDPLNPEENIRGGVTYLKQMYDKYQDPTLALAAYNAGPGRLDKALKSGQGIAALPRETQNYIRMASGGEVQHFEDGGQPRVGRASQAVGSSIFPESQRTTAARKKRTPEPTESELKNLGIQHQRQGEQDARAALPVEFNTSPVSMNNPTYEELGYKPSALSAAVPTPEENQFATFFKKLDQSEAALQKQRAEDKNMALLSAGLAMLGGESPYAFTNIGKGGLSGVSYLSEANKQRAAQQAALDKNRVAAMHYQNIGDYYKDSRLTKEERLALAKQKEIQSARDDYFQYQKMIDEGFNKQYPMAALTPEDPKTIKLKQEWLAKHSPILESLRMSAYPNLPAVTSSAPVSTQGYKLVK